MEIPVSYYRFLAIPPEPPVAISLLLHDGAGQAIEALLRRLDGPLDPFDIREIAGDALAVLRQNAPDVGERQRQLEEQRRISDQKAELAGASLSAMRMLLDYALFAGQSDDGQESLAIQTLQELRRRCEGTLRPADVIDIAKEAVTVLQEDAVENRRREREAGLAERQTEICDALVTGFESLLGALRLSSVAESDSPEAGERGMAGMLRLLKGPLKPEDIVRITDEAAATLKRDSIARTQLAAKQDALSQALIRALQLLVGSWPFYRGSGDSAGSPDRKRIDELLRRLEQPLVPYDVVEIATDAPGIFEEGSGAAADVRGEAGRSNKPAVDLSDALLQALRLILGGLPPSDALAALEQSKAATLEHHRLINEERQAMISMLTESVAGLSVQQSASVARLQEIERRVEQASMVEDPRSLKANLAECLGAVREAAASRQKQSSETLQLLERRIKTVKSSTPRLRRPEMEEVVRIDARADSKPAEYIVVFLLDRESSIGARFGEEVRQSILRFVNQRLKESLLASDRIVRWKSAAFLVSIQRSDSILDVRSEMSTVATIRTAPSVELAKRSIRLPISFELGGLPPSRALARSMGCSNTWINSSRKRRVT